MFSGFVIIKSDFRSMRFHKLALDDDLLLDRLLRGDRFTDNGHRPPFEESRCSLRSRRLRRQMGLDGVSPYRALAWRAEWNGFFRLIGQHHPQLPFHIHEVQGFEAEAPAGAVEAPAVQRLVNRPMRATDEELAVRREKIAIVIQRDGDVPAGVLIGDQVPADVRREALAPDALVGEDELARAAGREVGGGTEGLGAAQGRVFSNQCSVFSGDGGTIAN